MRHFFDADMSQLSISLVDLRKLTAGQASLVSTHNNAIIWYDQSVQIPIELSQQRRRDPVGSP